jgi:pterin-4a-carbinolamine dehydratase
MTTTLKELMKEYKEKALSSTLPTTTPVRPLSRRSDKFPVFPTTRWNNVDNKLRKRFTFASAETLLRFITDVTEHSESCGHHGVITINKRTVDITVWTRNLSIVTEIDREFANCVDEIYKDIINSEIAHGKSWEDADEQ